jgi:hypothetical protein
MYLLGDENEKLNKLVTVGAYADGKGATFYFSLPLSRHNC